MIFVRLIAALVREKTVRQTVRRAMFDYAGVPLAVIRTGRFRTRTFFHVRTLHLISLLLYYIYDCLYQ